MKKYDTEKALYGITFVLGLVNSHMFQKWKWNRDHTESFMIS